MKKYVSLLIMFVAAVTAACGAAVGQATADAPEIVVGAARTDTYIPLLLGQRVGLLSNATGMVGDRHTVDLMLDGGVDVVTLFSPEHGFRGKADAGQQVDSSTDELTGLPIVSLYGRGSQAALESAVDSCDVIVVDLQDVGTRFYTYYITMLRLMNRAALTGKTVMVLDRPNPNGMYVDGPVLHTDLYSGVGKLPIPVVHGMTLGELARMIVGEGWLDEGRKLDLDVIACLNYTHDTHYDPPVAPSPNLPGLRSILLYPSLCYFEGTRASVGRGTDHPFECYGHPWLKSHSYQFTPESRQGATNPPLKGQLCRGRDLTVSPSADSIIARGVDLSYVIDAYNDYKRNAPAGAKPFFIPFFDNLIGDRNVRRMIEQGYTADQIKRLWAADVERFKKRRQPYLLYR